MVLDNSIQPIQQYRNVSGKNSSDSSLIIDAMDLLHSHEYHAFAIVASDSELASADEHDIMRLMWFRRDSAFVGTLVMGVGYLGGIDRLSLR